MLVMGDLNVVDLNNTKIPILSFAYYYFSIVTFNIVMLNALIALLGDSWGSVQENKVAYF